jgi:hypothetical protein
VLLLPCFGAESVKTARRVPASGGASPCLFGDFLTADAWKYTLLIAWDEDPSNTGRSSGVSGKLTRFIWTLSASQIMKPGANVSRLYGRGRVVNWLTGLFRPMPMPSACAVSTVK